MRWTTRAAERRDAPALVRLIDQFAADHPAAKVSRDPETLARHYLGEQRLVQVIVAERAGALVGFVVWRRAFDCFWSMECGELTEMFVVPEHRGLGAAVALIAAACRDIRAAGGQYLCGYPGEGAAPLCDRVAISYPARWCHVSEAAFHRLADLAGADLREVVRRLPDPSWNKLDGQAVAARGPGPGP